MKIYCRFLTLAIFCPLCLIPFNAVSASVLRGSVVEILDAGTITVKVDNRVIKVSLCTVTPPAKDSALAEIARLHLASLIKGNEVAIDVKGLEQDGRVAGIVKLAETDLGMQLVRDGAAAYNRTYENVLSEESRRLYEESEQAARREARGIWQPVPQSSTKQAGESNASESGSADSLRREGRKLNDEAYTLIQQQNYRAALPKCREAIRLDPNLAEAHKNLALIFCELGRYAEALPECQEAIRLKPDLDKSHNVMGKILFGLGDYEGSVKAYREAIRLNSRYAKAHFNLGVSLQALGQFKQALASYQEADALAPNQAVVQLNIGFVLYRLGQRVEARKLWKKVLTMGDPVAAMLAEGNLNSLP
jgi:tetratricopeptide (TPR) repeat protein